jgi:YVTN family beta-propeller protein
MGKAERYLCLSNGIEGAFMKRYGVAILLSALAAMLCGLGTAWAVTYAYIPSYANDSVVRVNTSEQAFDSVTFGGDPCSPFGAAVAPDGSFVVITCLDEDAVTAVTNDDFDADTDPETAAVGNEPRGVAIDPEGDYVYVANYGEDTVSVINVDTITLIETLDVGDGPYGVAAIHQESPSRIKVYVSNYNAGTVSVLTYEGGAYEVTTINSVGINPVGVAATPDGRFIYVANYNNGQTGSVMVIQTEDDTIVESIQAGRGPWGVAIGAKGQYAFVTNAANNANSVTLISTENFSQITNTVGTMPFGVAAPKNGDFAYAINQMGNLPISEVDTSLAVTPIAQDATHPIEGAYALGTFIGGTPPERPTNLTVAADGDDLTLSWTDNSSDEVGFKIERRILEDSGTSEDDNTTDDNATDESDTSAFREIAEADENATEYTDTTVVGDNSYEYRIRAYNEAADSNYATSTQIVAPESESFSWCFIGTLLD